MGIVIVTIPGSAKMAFANALHARTGGAVDLVIVQHWKPDSYGNRFKRLRSKGVAHLLKEAWSAILLRTAPRLRQTLDYFRGSSFEGSLAQGYVPKVLEVESMDDEKTIAILKELAPDLLVVWGSKILKPNILSSAKRTINLHIGHCPHYRGTLANQCAVLDMEIEKIGATVHYVSERVDAGNVLSIIRPDLTKAPRELFRDLNDRAQETYIDIAARLYAGEDLPATVQDQTKGKNLVLRDWTPYMRYRVAKQMRNWERVHEGKHKKIPG